MTQAVPVAAALAITSFTNNTEAFVSGTSTIQAPESITISASSVNSVSTSANASTVSTTPGSGAVGVGVAINIANSTSNAFVAGNTNLESPTVSIGAPLTWTSGMSYIQGQVVTDPNNGSTYVATVANTLNTSQAPGQDPSEWQQVSDSFSANAVSGQGDPSSTTVGSLALTLVTVSHQATVGNGSSNPGSVDAGADNSNVALSSASMTQSTANATPGGQVVDPNAAAGGVGAAVAINVLNDSTNSAIDDGSTLSGANNLTLTSTTSDALNTTAVDGSQTGEALTPAVAISIANVDTNASVGQSPAGSAPTLTLTGSLDAEATQNTSVTTTAEGGPTTGSLSPAIAISDVNDEVTAVSYYPVVAGGPITLNSAGASAITTTAIPADAGSSDGSLSSHLGQATNDVTVSTASGAPSESTGPIGPGDPSIVGSANTPDFAPATAAASAPAALTVESGGSLAPASGHTAADGGNGVATTQGEPLSGGGAITIKAGAVTGGASITARDSLASTGLSLSGLISSSGPAGALQTSSPHNFTTTAIYGPSGSDTANMNGGLALQIIDVNATASQTGADLNTSRGPPTADLNADNSATGGEFPIQATVTPSRPDATAAINTFDPDASSASTAENFGDPLNTIAAQSGATA